MAPIGTVIKNGLVYLVISAPLVYLAALQFVNGIADILFATSGGTIAKENIDSSTQDWLLAAQIEFALGLAISLIGVGIVYMKALSDTVEDGMIEF